MGKIEDKVKRNLRRNELRRVVLGVVSGVGLLSVAILAPNVIGALGKMGVLPRNRRRREIINRARDRLLEQGLLGKDEQGYLRITEKGRLELERLEFGGASLKKPKRWDEKWRIIIFDIAERKKNIRNKIRWALRTAGFRKLQHSVWVYPYPCEDFIAILKVDLHIGKELVYIVTDEIEGDYRLREAFRLLKN